MTNSNRLQHWALTALLSLALGACAHQEGNQAQNDVVDNEGVPTEASASAEGAESLGDTASNKGAVHSDELAPLPSTSAEGDMLTSEGDLAASAQPTAGDVPPAVSAQDSILPSASLEGPAPAPQPAVKPKAQKAKKVSQKSAHKTASLVLPTQPIERQGELMNRFYIIRNGDSAERVSELMYGTKEKTKELQAWNPGAWKAGSLIYYLSPLQPADGEMRSFYQERGIVPTEYEVKRGDTLASIATAIYGAKDSWKEIGLLNGIQTDTVAPGTKIALFPANLSAYSLKLEPSKSATKSSSVDKQIDTLENQITKLEAEISKSHPTDGKSAMEAGPIGSKPLLGETEKKDLAAVARERQKARAGLGNHDDEGQTDVASAEVASFFQQNMTLVIGLLAALAGFAVFFFIRRSRDSDL